MFKKKKKFDWKKKKSDFRSDFKAADTKESPLGTPTNAPQWYYPSPEIQKLASAVNMNNATGLPVRYADGINFKAYSKQLLYMPGVASNRIMHVPGKATRPTDPVNDASRSQMNRIREVINATRNYEMPDLIKYFISIADLFAWIEFLKTVYRTVRRYTPLNRYTPTVLLRAMHIDTSDINNLGIQLKFYINTLVHRVRNLKVPLDIPMLPTWIEDYKHIFVDEDIEKAQYIVNLPAYVWKYTIDPDTGKSVLIPSMFATVYTASSPAKFDDLKNFTEDLLSALVNDEDFAILTGDIMKSYSSFYELSEVGDEIIEFEYSKEFLEKWHNAAIFPSLNIVGTGVDWKIEEDTSSNLDPFIVFNPKFTFTSDADYNSVRRGCGNRMLDFYDREITSDQIINACLWLWSFVGDDATKTVHFNTVNTSLVGDVELWYFNQDGILTYNNYFGVVHLARENNRMKFVHDNAILSLVLSKWNYYPFAVFIVDSNDDDANDVGYLGILGDLGNFTIVDSRILENVATCILYGQYNINYLLRG